MADETPKEPKPVDPLDDVMNSLGDFTNVTQESGAPLPTASSTPPPVAGEMIPEPTAALGGLTADLAELEALLKQAEFDSPTPASGTSSSGSAAQQNDLASILLNEARAVESQSNSKTPQQASTASFDLPSFQQVVNAAQASSIDLLRDVELNVKIELGRSKMLVEDVLKLIEGSVVELDKLAGDPVDVFVNERLVARGEVLVLNENFCVRVNEIIATSREET